MAQLSLDPSLWGVEVDCSETVATPSGQTPTAKRQRRLTLTAMTGLICELAQESAVGKVELDGVAANGEAAAQAPRVNETAPPQDRESSPLRRLKRSRASISATAKADVMAAQALKMLRSPVRVKVTFASESSDSTQSEEEDDSLALRVRRSQAFDIGSLGAVMQSSPGGRSEGELSPRSKIAFDRGARAAQVAAKVAAAMMPETPGRSKFGGH